MNEITGDGSWPTRLLGGGPQKSRRARRQEQRTQSQQATGQMAGGGVAAGWAKAVGPRVRPGPSDQHFALCTSRAPKQSNLYYST